MIYYFDDDGKATGVGTVGEKHNAADLHEPPGGGVNFDFGHCGRSRRTAVSENFLAAAETRTG